jgi:hypothetical protein
MYNLDSKYGEYESGILYTLVLCTRTTEVEEESEDLWLPIGIDLKSIESFKMAAPDEDEEHEIAGKVYVYTGNNGYTLYVPFVEFKKFFRAWKLV